MAGYQANDSMIRRLERELEERNAAVQGIVSTAQDTERDLNDAEKETMASLRDRMGQIKDQLQELESTREAAEMVSSRMKKLDQALTTARKVGDTEVEYRSAGHYALDAYKSAMGDRTATERIELFHRAAAHQKTTDNLGVVPDPIIGDVLNFIGVLYTSQSPRDTERSRKPSSA
jgi:DNA repair exonuclease SbcCD ATPase subunit